VLPPQAPILLVALDYDQSQMPGPPFATSRQQVHELFADTYACEELECRQVIDTHPHFRQRGLSSLEESAFLLRRP
jgi:thiopurine S-methyltransferase